MLSSALTMVDARLYVAVIMETLSNDAPLLINLKNLSRNAVT